jgi:hypothetical protein
MSLVRKEEAEKDHTNYAQQLIDLHDQWEICCSPSIFLSRE